MFAAKLLRLMGVNRPAADSGELQKAGAAAPGASRTVLSELLPVDACPPVKGLGKLLQHWEMATCPLPERRE